MTGTPGYMPGNKYENVIFDYYKYIDDEIGRTLALLDDDTLVLIVSDHGAMMMEGGICINEWLINNGYLKLVHYPDEVTQISKHLIDWDKTTVWGEGGYYGRLFFNVKGREPRGIIPRQNYEFFRNELIAALEDQRDETGRKINTRVFKPEEHLHGMQEHTTRFDCLLWRSGLEVYWQCRTQYNMGK